MAYEINLAPRVVKYLRKLKDQSLKKKMVSVIYDTIAVDPFAGIEKKGDLRGYYTCQLRHDRTAYRIAYTVETDGAIVIIVLAGSHEGFYEQLKRIAN